MDGGGRHLSQGSEKYGSSREHGRYYIAPGNRRSFPNTSKADVVILISGGAEDCGQRQKSSIRETPNIQFSLLIVPTLAE